MHNGESLWMQQQCIKKDGNCPFRLTAAQYKSNADHLVLCSIYNAAMQRTCSFGLNLFGCNYSSSRHENSKDSRTSECEHAILWTNALITSSSNMWKGFSSYLVFEQRAKPAVFWRSSMGTWLNHAGCWPPRWGGSQQKMKLAKV